MPTYSSEWDKGDFRANNEQRGRMGFGGTEHGGQQYASRSRMLGSEAQGRGAYQSDFGQGNQARGVTGEGVNLALSAARGQQPSAAEILARRNTAAGVRAGQSMAAGIKGGPGARVAAMRNAQRMGAQQIAEGGARAEQLRAQEMADARGQVIQGGTAMRQGDHDAQRIQQQNELTQRGMNDAQQRFFENQGFNTQVQDQNNQLQQQGMAAGMWNAGRASEQAGEAFDFGKTMKYVEAASGAASGAVGGAAGAMTSDEEAKNLVPAGSLAPLFGGGRGAANPGVSAGAPASFDKLSSGGGMDVTGSLKAHSNFATKFQRDPSGGMMSDWRSKDVMYSPGEIKTPATLDDAMAQGRESADPYATTPDIGVTGAPRGYAAQRTSADVTGQDPGLASGYEKKSISNSAPGTDDWQKFGAPAAKDGPVDWAHGGSTTPQGAKPNAVMGSLAGFLGGLSGGARMRSDMASKNPANLMTSDARAKDDAFKLGMEMGQAKADQKAMMAQPGWKPMSVGAKDMPSGDAADRGDGRDQETHASDPSARTTASREKDGTLTLAPVTVTSSPERSGHRSAAGASKGAPEKWEDEQFEIAKRGTAAREGMLGDREWDRGRVNALPPKPEVVASLGKVRSDEKAKNVVDLKDDVTMTDPKDEKAFQAWKKKFAHPQDDGEDYDLRGAWKAGLKPGDDGHWPDTFKRPNHPTFSNESKYADNEGAKPGRWDGDTFIPHRGATPDGSSMRDGSSDPRTRNFDESFRRDTKADQARVKKGVEDKAGKDADAMMASMRASMGQGPTARSEDLQDDAPDLREAAKAGGDAGRIPEHAMFKAMKAMEPSLYSYKPEFRPPEQAPGEVQAGPMANNMERDPIAGTAITRDPGTGLLAIDKDKALKLTMGSLAVLADDVESLKRKKKGAR
jgi:hypothetical protein